MGNAIDRKPPTESGGNEKCEAVTGLVGLPKPGFGSLSGLKADITKKPGRVWTYGILDFIGAEIARIYSAEKGEVFFLALGEHPDYDIASASRKTTIELKVETSPIRTGNVAIEIWNTDYNKPSGILGTTALLWTHVVPHNGSLLVIEYEVPALKKLIRQHGERGRSHNALLKLIPLDIFKKMANRTFDFHSRFYEELMVTTGAKKVVAKDIARESTTLVAEGGSHGQE